MVAGLDLDDRSQSWPVVNSRREVERVGVNRNPVRQPAEPRSGLVPVIPFLNLNNFVEASFA
jgi:hypothetical protein